MRTTLLLVSVVCALAPLAACGSSAPKPSADDLIRDAGALDLAGNHNDAIRLFRQALQQAPDSYGAHYGIGRALDLNGQYDEARQHFAKAVEVAQEGNRDQAMRMMAIACTFAGNINEATRIFTQVFDRRIAAANFGAAAEVANEVGRVYLEHSDLDDAEKWYRSARTTALRETDLADWRVDLVEMRWEHAEARIAARRGNTGQAHRHQAEVKALLDKGGNDDQRNQYPYLAGYVAFYLRDYRAAIAELEQADQKDPFILLLLAQAHEKTGDQARARDYYGRVMGSTSHAVNNAFARPIAREKLAQ
jgi:tetratricopeptide (TPR) repeat protein